MTGAREEFAEADNIALLVGGSIVIPSLRTATVRFESLREARSTASGLFFLVLAVGEGYTLSVRL